MVYQNDKPYFSKPKKFNSLEALMSDVNSYKNNPSFNDYKLVVNETHSDNMSTGLFADEEDGYNLDDIKETKFKLKVPNSEPSVGDSLDGLEDLGGDEFGDEFGDDLGGDEFGDNGGNKPSDKPFNDEPFEAGVEADEETEPDKYIQQLAGKIGQSLRSYSDQEGQPDFDLEKFVVNSVLSATHTGQMDSDDQSDIIKKVKSSGKNSENIDVNVDVDTDGKGGDVNVDTNTDGEGDEMEESSRFGNHNSLNTNIGEDDTTMVKNLKNMKTDAEKILSMDKSDRVNKLKGMGWADDHISTSADDAEEVADFLTTENGEIKLWSSQTVNEKKSDEKKDDRCTRIAKRKYDTWPSAYASGAVVKCRKGKIWKNESVESNSIIENTEYEESLTTEEKEGLHKWFSRQGGEGSSSGWVDCNTCREVDGKNKCKPCGRKDGEKRAKYPACRPTPSACKSKGKGKSWGKKSESIEESFINALSEGEYISEAEYKGKKVKLNKPSRGDVKKYKVYVKNDKGNVVKVNFGDKNMEIKRDDPERRKSFRARHKCDQKKDKTSAGYWSCKMWSSRSVSNILGEDLENGKKMYNFVSKKDIMKKLIEATEVKPKVKPKTAPDVKPTRRQKPFRPTIQPKVEPKANTDNGVLSEVNDINGKIINTKFLDKNIAIVKVNLGDSEIDLKFENTGEYIDKPLAYDEPWVYNYESIDSPDGKTYVLGVEFYGNPDTNLELSDISSDYIEEIN